jgi:predicted MFS family arabinose efflux permease
MSQSAPHDVEISRSMVLLLAASCGLIVANLYYAQTLAGPISAATGLSVDAAGLVVTLTQVGYALGLLFIVPLGDLLENRRLIVCSLIFTAVALMGAALSTTAWTFLAAAFAIGLGSTAAQVLVPFAAHLSTEAKRGQTVGRVVSGLLLGIMLARPASSLIADHTSWQAVFGGASVLILILAVVLRIKLPARLPDAPPPYTKLIGSLWRLFVTTPVLRRRAAYQFGLFGAFSLFWTVAPMMLAGPAFNLSHTGIAIFALVGMAGAIASPIAGRLADGGYTLPATAVALLLGVAGFALPLLAPNSGTFALGLLAVASIVLDMGVAASLVLGQRAIFTLAPEVRSRLNGMYIALFFAGGALGSAIGGLIFARFGWHAVLLAGMAFPGLALVYWLTEYLKHLAVLNKAA